MQLTWKPSSSSSALHATELVAHGHSLSDAALQSQLAPLADALEDMGQRSISGKERFWDWLIGLSSEYENNIQLAERVIAKTHGTSGIRPDLPTKLAELIQQSERALTATYPKIEEELPLRLGPMQELWNTYGPGLMVQVGKYSDPALVVKEATIIPVYPMVGGHGGVLLQSNRCWIEAVLTNSTPTLPEVLRLAWLLSQLEADLPIHGELVNSGRLPWISSLAMLPPVLLAAQELELGQFSEDQLLLAIEKWWIPNPTEHSLVDTLLSWWDTYSSERPAWRIALTALDKMLQ
jgi:hypothetical protein